MAMAKQQPLIGVLKTLFQPAAYSQYILPVLGFSASLALAVSHFVLWGGAYAEAISPFHLQLTLIALFASGWLLGGLLVLWLSEGTPQLGLVPVAAVGLVCFDWGLVLPDYPSLPASLSAYWCSDWGQMVMLLGFWVALFGLPQLGLLLMRTSAVTLRQNTLLLLVFVALALVVGCAGAWLLQRWGMAYDALALAGILVGVLVLWQLPTAFLQFFAWIFIHVFYRIQARDLHHIPARGPVLLVCNHVSFIDAFVVGGTIKRPPRFVMDKGFYEVPLLNWVFRTAKAIPIAPAKKDPEMLARAYDKIAEELQNGQVVLVFPEGAITWDGEMIEFKEGVERIIKRTPVRVVPIALRGLWGSWFSRSKGGTFKGLPSFWKKLELRAGEVMQPEEATAAELQKRVQNLRGDWR